MLIVFITRKSLKKFKKIKKFYLKSFYEFIEIKMRSGGLLVIREILWFFGIVQSLRYRKIYGSLNVILKDGKIW
jgi:hypothetical protein